MYGKWDVKIKKSPVQNNNELIIKSKGKMPEEMTFIEKYEVSKCLKRQFFETVI